ncbi:MAG: ABC transporter substrate-binding protein [Actinomycetota bacterium]
MSGLGRWCPRLALVLLMAGVACTPRSSTPTLRATADAREPHIALLAPPDDPRTAGLRRAAVLAAEEVSTDPSLGRRLVISEPGPPSGRLLARLAADPASIGVLTIGGGAAIAQAADVLEAEALPVVELTDDLYGAGALGPTVFQTAIPHSWQAWRLARYFGPGDRRYRRVGLAREAGREGDVAAGALSAAARERGVEFVDATGPAEQGLAALEGERVDAVVVEGPPAFRAAVTALLASRPYAGRAGIHDGWRPQLAGFAPVLDEIPTREGTVAVSDYAGLGAGQRLPGVRAFRDAYRARWGEAPPGSAVAGYDAVRAVAEAVRRAGPERRDIITGLETFDRVRFGRLPISLGPDDHLFSERDVLGLWGKEGDSGWLPVMRTFTSDLERTDILEDDWPSFFEGTVPGGEAPFFRAATYGITSDAGDDLR